MRAKMLMIAATSMTLTIGVAEAQSRRPLACGACYQYGMQALPHLQRMAPRLQMSPGWSHAGKQFIIRQYQQNRYPQYRKWIAPRNRPYG
jgi:hypothetical protein